ncbi:MAG TPA: HDIG domain-containing protein [Phycisphaerales bacterium]|nr:HDIG domain-containing protein [Phycisphaerales bacterium]
MSPVENEDGFGSGRGRAGGRGSVGQRLTRWMVGSPGSVWAVAILLGLGVLLSLASIVMSRQVLVSPGQVVDHTRVARVETTVLDPAAAEAQRKLARDRAPKVFVGDETRINEIIADVRGLPGLLAAAGSFEAVPADVRSRFGLTPESYSAVATQWQKNQVIESWARRCDKLGDLLRARPLVDAQTFAQQTRSTTDRIELDVGGSREIGSAGDLMNAEDRLLETRLGQVAVQAGFFGDALSAVTARLAYQPAPTFRYDHRASIARQDEAAARVQPTVERIAPGDVLYRLGDRLTSETLARAQAEQDAYDAQTPPAQLAADAGTGVAMLLVTLGVGAYLGTFATGMVAKPRRLAALCGLFAGAALVSSAAALVDAKLIAAAMVVPPVFLAAVLVVAYERRTALAVGSLLTLCTALVLHQPLIGVVPALAAVWLMVWQLRELRHRGALIRAGFFTGLLTGGVTLLIGAVRVPLTDASAAQSATEAVSVGVGVLLVGFVVLGLLPTIERSFKVVTALSLIELRDPSHPLLRRLQQRAPGTYSHSMNVATLAESAARAIGGDALLAYVGALYHDVGKMNRPEFFIENQTGVNRHDRLPPAMSTLMIVSHVPDGVQLAREYTLPRPLHHFIESHHGTTVVEYFFRRAVKQYDAACAKDESARAGACPTEGEYRYPGPKPRTKEVACVMVCDAAESTARTMADPSAVKIEQMVRAIADRRLSDGQFDECELTMAELTTIVATVSKALASIYHQRVVYPEGPKTAGGAGVPVAKPLEPKPPAEAARAS